MPRPIPKFLLVLLLSTVACSGDSAGPTGAECPVGTASVTATVTQGAGPVFSWTPACAVAFLIVEEDASDMWWISPFADEEALISATPEAANRIAPPVTYGQVPAGMAHSDETLPLVSGRSYDVALWRMLPAGSQSLAQCQTTFENLCLLTVLTFTR
jgi:hypothetical protein